MTQLWLAGRRIGFVIAATMLLLVMTSTVLAQNADLSIMKSGPNSIFADTDIEYLVSVSNFSGETSTGPNTLTDTFPAELTFTAAVVPDGWTCTTPPVAGPNTITCTSSDPIPDESSVVFTFTFHVAPGLSLGTQVTNSASISHAGTDGNSENNSSSFTSTVGTPPPAPLMAGEVLISEFRLSGPGGSEDDYIELYCNRNTNCDISGTALRGYDPSQVVDFTLTFPGQTIIPARHYLLVADSRGYTLSFYGLPDFDVALMQPPEPEPPISFHDNEGLQLIGADDPIIIDSVGFAGGGNQENYVEGTGLQRAGGIMPSRPADQYAYVRKRTLATNGLPQDTNNNANDFVLVSVTGNLHPGIDIPPVLGAPGPQGLTSAFTYNNGQIPGTLTDPTKSKEDDPNRVRDGVGDSGTLSLRRSFNNNTPSELGYVAFRVIETSTLNSPITLAEPQADLRLITSSETTAEVPSRGGTVPIFGTVLEFDDICGCPEPKQPNGGGLNSTVSIDFGESEGGIPPGGTFDVQYLFNVVKAGTYRFYVYVEAVPFSIRGIEATQPTSTSGPSGRARIPSKTGPARKFATVKRARPAAFMKQALKTPVVTTMTGPNTSPATTPSTSPARLSSPRVIILNRYKAEDEKKPRRKTRLKRKSSATMNKTAEQNSAVAEKPRN